jgi:hypothetical protein
MPLQNRVDPFGEIAAHPARGLFMGNRGILHDTDRRLGRARWKHKVWIVCLTEFRGRKRTVMTPRRYTELFFLDEATALAAGHRPCFECRRRDFHRFLDAWMAGTGWIGASRIRAGELDGRLHAERVDRGTRRQRTWRSGLDDLPDGALVTLDDRPDEPLLVLGDALLPWRFEGYGRPRPQPRSAEATVLTPPSTVAALRAGYAPALHPSAAG